MVVGEEELVGGLGIRVYRFLSFVSTRWRSSGRVIFRGRRVLVLSWSWKIVSLLLWTSGLVDGLLLPSLPPPRTLLPPT